MGERIIRFYKENVSKEYKWAFISTFVIGLLVHIYKFTNTLLNHDSLYNFYSSQNVLGSGRWALSLACGISSYYDLPWINGVLSIVWIALTVVVIAALFRMKNPILIALSGAILVSSIATTETFQFMFTADGYMLAMLLAALGVYCMRIGQARVSRLVIGGVCICVCCGIYQAYVSFALVLALCHFIYELFRNQYSPRDRRRWIVAHVLVYSLSMVVYYGIWKLCLFVTGTAVNDYQGISEVGQMNLGLIVNGIKQSITTPIFHWLQWNVFEHGWSLYAVLNMAFCVVAMLTFVMICAKTKLYRDKGRLALLVVSLAALFPFACIWHFTSEEVSYAARMLQSLYLLYILIAVLAERFGSTLYKNGICLLLTIIVCNNSLMANISYFYMNLCYERTYAEGVEMMMKIHDIQNEHEVDCIAVIGTNIYDVEYTNLSIEEGEKNTVYAVTANLEKTLMFNQDQIVRFLRQIMGLELDEVSTEEQQILESSEVVQEMPIWPAEESVKVIDGTLVIKLADRIE